MKNSKFNFFLKRKNSKLENDLISVVDGFDAHLFMHMYQSPKNENDKVNGAILWDKASVQKSYYLKWNEIKAIKKHSKSISKIIGNNSTIIDLGPGVETSIENKTMPFLKSFKKNNLSINGYMAVDLTQEYISNALKIVKKFFPKICLVGKKLDFFNKNFNIKMFKKPVLFCAGCTIVNILEKKETPYNNIKKVLKKFHKMIKKTGYLVVIQDINQDSVSLKKAYHNKNFERFTLNVLELIKRDVDSNFVPSYFSFKTSWNSFSKYFVRQALATKSQKIKVNNKQLMIKKNQTIDIVRSYKYSHETFKMIGESVGWKHKNVFFGENKHVAIHVFEVKK